MKLKMTLQADKIVCDLRETFQFIFYLMKKRNETKRVPSDIRAEHSAEKILPW